MTPTEPAQFADTVAPRLTVGSLFSGIGGIDLGLERAGMKVIWQSEIDPYAKRVLCRRWPDVPNLGDVTVMDWENDGLTYGDGITRSLYVDVLAGGFPCQPVSIAGAERGSADEHWLWPEFARAIRDLRPRWVVIENVPGLLRREFGTVLGDLAALGFDAEWESIPAAAVGAPHWRERVFVVAYPSGQRLQERRGSGPVPPQLDPAQCGGEGGYLGPRPRSGGWWESEPDVGRVAYGIPRRVDRLRCLGNAVVPLVAQWVGESVRTLAADDLADCHVGQAGGASDGAQ